MPSQGTPLGGRHVYIDRALVNGAALTLVAYTNTLGSLGPETVLATLTQPSIANGYAPILLNGTWSRSNGIATYVHPAGPNTDTFGNPCWFATGAWSAPVNGVALIYGADVVHFWDHRDANAVPASFVAAAGKRFPVDLASIFA